MTKYSVVMGIDLQNDFCPPDGSLKGTDRDQVMEPMNRMFNWAVKNNIPIILSACWHPPKTKHFEKWPVHCVQNTYGAEFHPNLKVPTNYPKLQIVHKGLGDEDDYSAFDTGIRPKAKHLYVGGLTTDFCVLWTVKKAIELGYKVTLLLDACRAVNINPGNGDKAVEEMQSLGVKISITDEVISEIEI